MGSLMEQQGLTLEQRFSLINLRSELENPKLSKSDLIDMLITQRESFMVKENTYKKLLAHNWGL